MNSTPTWMTKEGLATLQRGYLHDNETPSDMYWRVASSAESYLEKENFFLPGFKEDLYDILWNGLLGLASPVAANLGTNRGGLPISCYSLSVEDSISGIFNAIAESAKLTQTGGGLGINLGHIRPSGALIKSSGGKSLGVMPFAKLFDETAHAVSKGNVNRGSFALYLPIEHPDIKAFLLSKDKTRGNERRHLHSNIAVTITDKWMYSMLLDRDPEKMEIFVEVIKTRLMCGSPYLIFIDTINDARPQAYINNNLFVETSNLCCLPGETLVATKEFGHTPIKNLVGKNVTVFNGKDWVETSTFTNKGKSTVLYEITLETGEKFSMTPEHRNILEDGKTIKKAGELKVGDVLMSAKEYAEPSDLNLSNKTKAPYLKGFIIGDGTYAGEEINAAKLDLHDTKFMCEAKLLQSANEIDPRKSTRADAIVKPSFTEARTVSSGFDHSKKHKLKTMRGLSLRPTLTPFGKEYKKGFPEYIFHWPEKDKLEFLAGIFDADGTTDGQAIQYSQEYKQQLLDIQRLLNSLGISSRLDNYNRLLIPRNEGYKLGKMLPTVRLKFNGTEPNRVTAKHNKIKSIKKVNKSTDVYCPSIPSTGFFALANGVLTGNSEIVQHTSPNSATFSCCLSSLNLYHWDTIKNYTGHYTGLSVIELATVFLDCVLSEFIDKASKIPELHHAALTAQRERSLGLGSMGLAALYQRKGLPFESPEAKCLNISIHQRIHEETHRTSQWLGKALGEPELCVGTGYRNAHITAVAPTRTNSIICDAGSQGIEPIDRNYILAKQDKGTFIRKNKELIRVLESYGKNTQDTWRQIIEDDGSVKSLDFLSENEKNVFKTARELDQRAIIDQAADRQLFIDQAQSINLFFDSIIDPQHLANLHCYAWSRGVKSLYYLRAKSKQLQKSLNLLITQKNCAWCTRLKSALLSDNIEYVEMDIQEAKSKGLWHEEYKTTPQLFINGIRIGGYDDYMFSEEATECPNCEA